MAKPSSTPPSPPARMPDVPLDDLLTEKQFCERYHFTTRWARMLRETGLGPPYLRLGRAVFYRVIDLAEWEKSRTYRHRAAEAAAAA
jgi:hypothetical protein